MMAKSCDFGFTHALPVDKVIGILSDWCPQGWLFMGVGLCQAISVSFPLIYSSLLVAIFDFGWPVLPRAAGECCE